MINGGLQSFSLVLIFIVKYFMEALYYAGADLRPLVNNNMLIQ